MLFYLDNWQSVGPNAAQMAARRNAQPKARARPQRELRARADGAAHAGRRRRLHAAGCHRSGALLHRMDHSSSNGKARASSSTSGCTTTVRKSCSAYKIPAGGGIEDGLKVLDILAHHPSTARFISKKLAMRFVADNPPTSLIDKMAKTFQHRPMAICAL